MHQSETNDNAGRRSPLRHAWDPWMRFWFTPTDPIALHGLRVLIGLMILFWLLSFLGHQASLFGLGGWLDERAFVELSSLEIEERGPIAYFSPLFLASTTTKF